MRPIRSFLFYYSLYRSILSSFFFFFNATPTTAIYTLSLHDALRSIISAGEHGLAIQFQTTQERFFVHPFMPIEMPSRSEEHTSELQSHSDLVCRLLLEKKKKKITKYRL